MDFHFSVLGKYWARLDSLPVDPGSNSATDRLFYLYFCDSKLDDSEVHLGFVPLVCRACQLVPTLNLYMYWHPKH